MKCNLVCCYCYNYEIIVELLQEDFKEAMAMYINEKVKECWIFKTVWHTFEEKEFVIQLVVAMEEIRLENYKEDVMCIGVVIFSNHF